jgi:hypothetical protein
VRVENVITNEREKNKKKPIKDKKKGKVMGGIHLPPSKVFFFYFFREDNTKMEIHFSREKRRNII